MWRETVERLIYKELIKWVNSKMKRQFARLTAGQDVFAKDSARIAP